MNIYTLAGLTKAENVAEGYPSILLKRLRDENKPLEWRGYEFTKLGREWVAVKKGSPVNFIRE